MVSSQDDNIMNSLNDILIALGFSAEEIRVYSALLEHGPTAVGALSKKLGVVRSSLYGILKRLQDGGLIAQSQRAGVKLFSAQEPEKISLLFEQRIEDLRRKQEVYNAILPTLRAKRSSSLLKPTFQLFEGEEGMRNILKDMLLYHDLETQAFWPIKQMIDVLSPDFFRYLNKIRIESNLYTRAIWPQKQTVDVAEHPYLGVGKSFQREIRIAPPEIDCSMGYWIYGNKVAFISSRREAFGFIIESAELVELLLTQFEMIWKVSKPLEVNAEATEAFLKGVRTKKR